MKVRNIFILIAFIIGVAIPSLGAIKSTRLPEILDDNYGKVEGHIIDSETGEHVDERMVIFIYGYTSDILTPHLYTTETDEKGYFSFKLIPQKYFLYCGPATGKSVYCFEPFQVDLVENISEIKNLDHIEVKKGQITFVVKKAYHGGSIKIVLLDENGNKINPSERFYKNINIIGLITSKGILNEKSLPTSRDEHDLDIDGEVEIKQLYPAIYQIKLIFRYIGYGDVNFSVNVVSGQSVEKRVVIDMTNKTGIEGKLTDTNGNPIKGVEVTVGAGGFWGSGSDVTDQNGYYKIINLEPGLETIFFHYENEYGHNYSESFKLDIQQDILIRKNVVLKIE